MTNEMVTLARENQRKAGVTSGEIPEGRDRAHPATRRFRDVIIANCVIDVSADQDAVLAEACRVSRPGGRCAVSDVMVRGEVSSEIRRSVELWIGRVAGASEYRAKLAKAGIGTGTRAMVTGLVS
jgi:arsenite methyltransferase